LSANFESGQDRAVAEPQSPIDVALDLLVFAPLGFALSAREEIPKLAARGRATIDNQFTVAKMVGQFAVAQGRKELEKRLAKAGGLGAPPSDTRRQPPAQSEAQQGPDVSYDQMLGNERDGEDSASAYEAAAGQNSAGRAGAAQDDSSEAARALAIPGYDSLSASQVVQRLAGLSSEELAAVGAYESAHRARRTVLTRVHQLQAN
jgi:hypothetical protein